MATFFSDHYSSGVDITTLPTLRGELGL